MLMRHRFGYNIPKMPSDLTDLPLMESIPIPPVRTTFFPAALQASVLFGKAQRSSLSNVRGGCRR